jgi:hypothetical protein
VFATLSKDEVLGLVEYEEFKLFRAASGSGSEALIEAAFERCPRARHQEMVRARHFDGFHAAARNGFAGAMQKICDKLNRETVQAMISHNKFHCFKTAVENKCFSVLEFLIATVHNRSLKDMVFGDTFCAFESAVSSNRVKELELYLLHFDTLQPNVVLPMLRMALSRGCFEAATGLYNWYMLTARYNIDSYRNNYLKSYSDLMHSTIEMPDGLAPNLACFKLILECGSAPLQHKIDTVTLDNHALFAKAASLGCGSHIEFLLNYLMREIASHAALKNMISLDGYKSVILVIGSCECTHAVLRTCLNLLDLTDRLLAAAAERVVECMRDWSLPAVEKTFCFLASTDENKFKKLIKKKEIGFLKKCFHTALLRGDIPVIQFLVDFCGLHNADMGCFLGSVYQRYSIFQNTKNFRVLFYILDTLSLPSVGGRHLQEFLGGIVDRNPAIISTGNMTAIERVREQFELNSMDFVGALRSDLLAEAYAAGIRQGDRALLSYVLDGLLATHAGSLGCSYGTLARRQQLRTQLLLQISVFIGHAVDRSDMDTLEHLVTVCDDNSILFTGEAAHCTEFRSLAMRSLERGPSVTARVQQMFDKYGVGFVQAIPVEPAKHWLRTRAQAADYGTLVYAFSDLLAPPPAEDAAEPGDGEGPAARLGLRRALLSPLDSLPACMSAALARSGEGAETVVDCLLGFMTEEERIQFLFPSVKYQEVVVAAVSHYNEHMMMYLLEKAIDKDELACLNGFELLRCTAAEASMGAVCCALLGRMEGGSLRNAIAHNRFQVFRLCVASGHVAAVQRIFTFLQPFRLEINRMIAAGGYEMFNASLQFLEVAKLLIVESTVFYKYVSTRFAAKYFVSLLGPYIGGKVARLREHSDSVGSGRAVLLRADVGMFYDMLVLLAQHFPRWGMCAPLAEYILSAPAMRDHLSSASFVARLQHDIVKLACPSAAACLKTQLPILYALFSFEEFIGGLSAINYSDLSACLHRLPANASAICDSLDCSALVACAVRRGDTEFISILLGQLGEEKRCYLYVAFFSPAVNKLDVEFLSRYISLAGADEFALIRDSKFERNFSYCAEQNAVDVMRTLVVCLQSCGRDRLADALVASIGLTQLCDTAEARLQFAEQMLDKYPPSDASDASCVSTLFLTAVANNLNDIAAYILTHCACPYRQLLAGRCPDALAERVLIGGDMALFTLLWRCKGEAVGLQRMPLTSALFDALYLLARQEGLSAAGYFEERNPYRCDTLRHTEADTALPPEPDPAVLAAAAALGDVGRVRRLMGRRRFEVEAFEACLRAAISGGHLSLVDFLLTREVSERPRILLACRPAFIAAIIAGNAKMVETIIDIFKGSGAKKEYLYLSSASDLYAKELAFERSYRPMQVRSSRPSLPPFDGNAFWVASVHDQIPIMKMIIAKLPEFAVSLFQGCVEAAAGAGNTAAVGHLIELGVGVSVEQVLLRAIAGGQIDTLRHLTATARFAMSEQVLHNLKLKAARSGNVEILNFLFELEERRPPAGSTDPLQRFVSLLIAAVEARRESGARYLLDGGGRGGAPEAARGLQHDTYLVFLVACRHPMPQIFRLMFEYVDATEIRDMIASRNYEGLNSIITSRDENAQNALTLLFEYMSVSDINNAVQYRRAHNLNLNGTAGINCVLLRHSHAYVAYAALHHRGEYDAMLAAAAGDKMRGLREREEELRASDPNGVFDAGGETEGLYCCVLIKYLIRLRTPGSVEDIQFLLRLPSVLRLAASSLTGITNELLLYAQVSILFMLAVICNACSYMYSSN